jgi:O-antigen/teichoic acid export membrane protein
MGKDESLLKIGRETSIIMAGFVLGTFFQYLYKMVLARSLGPSSFGVFTQGLGLVQTAAILSLAGLQLSIPHFMSLYSGKGKKEDIGKIVSLGIYVLIAISLSISAFFYIFSEMIALQIFDEPALVTPLKIFSFTVIPLAGMHFTKALFRGRQDALRKVIVDDFIWSGFIVLFVLISAFLGYGVSGAVGAYFAGTLISVLLGFLLYWRRSSHGFVLKDLPARKLAFFSWPLFLISAFMILNRWFDVLMLGWLGQSSQAGIYDISYSLAGYVALLFNSIGFIFMPLISELYGEQKFGEIRRVYRTTTRWLITLTLPLLAGMLIFPEEIIRILFGSQYVSGKIPMMLLSAGFFYKVAKGPSHLVLISAGKTKKLMLGSATIAFFIVVLNLLLIPEYGIVGAAVSTLVAYLVGDTVILLLAVNEINGFPYDSGFLRVLPPITAASSAVLILKQFLTPGLLGSVLMGVLLVSIYFSSLYMFKGVRKEDYKLFNEFRSSLNN